MEVHFNSGLQAKLDKLAIETGRAAGELVEDVVVGTLTSWRRRGKCSTAVMTTLKAAE